jgi:DNA-binding CsgD family transcriptional regulator
MIDPAVLTDKERDVLTFAADGLSNADIGLKVQLGEQTVKTYMRRIMRKLGALNRTEAVAMLLRDAPVGHCDCCRRGRTVVAGYRVSRNRYPDDHPWSKMYDRFATALQADPSHPEVP